MESVPNTGGGQIEKDKVIKLIMILLIAPRIYYDGPIQNNTRFPTLYYGYRIGVAHPFWIVMFMSMQELINILPMTPHTLR